jgi:hypothetical protein
MIVLEVSHRLTVEQMSSFLEASSGLELEARTSEEARRIIAEVTYGFKLEPTCRPKMYGMSVTARTSTD